MRLVLDVFVWKHIVGIEIVECSAPVVEYTIENGHGEGRILYDAHLEESELSNYWLDGDEPTDEDLDRYSVCIQSPLQDRYGEGLYAAMFDTEEGILFRLGAVGSVVCEVITNPDKRDLVLARLVEAVNTLTNTDSFVGLTCPFRKSPCLADAMKDVYVMRIGGGEA